MEDSKDQNPQQNIDDLIKKYETETKDKLPEVPAEMRPAQPAADSSESRPASADEPASSGISPETAEKKKGMRHGKAPLIFLSLLVATAGYWSWNRFIVPGKKSKIAGPPPQSPSQPVPLVAEPSVPPVKKEDGIPIFGAASEVETAKADGITTKSYKVQGKLEEVQLFYQKELTQEGFVIYAGQSLSDTGLAFRKGMNDLYISLKQLGDEVGIVLSYKVQ